MGFTDVILAATLKRLMQATKISVGNADRIRSHSLGRNCSLIDSDFPGSTSKPPYAFDTIASAKKKNV